LSSFENLQIGTYGWLHESWSGSYYPEDLPEEWRLDYFSNVFKTALVPMSEWTLWSSDELEEIAESVEDGFNLFLAIEKPVGIEAQQQLETLVTILGDAIQGLVVFGGELTQGVDLMNLPVTLISETTCLAGWNWQFNALTMSGNPCGLLQNLPSDGRKQAEILKSFVSSLPKGVQGAPLFVSGDLIDMKDVVNLKTVGELLGF